MIIRLSITQATALSAVMYFGMVPLSHADGDWQSWLISLDSQKEVQPVTDEQYKKEYRNNYVGHGSRAESWRQ